MSSKHAVVITKISCHGQSESGHDEVYLTYQADGSFVSHFPDYGDYKSMNDGDDWYPNLTLEFDNEVLLCLWDQDLKYVPSVATFLQCQVFVPEDRGYKNEVKLKNPNGADYHVHFTYIK